MIVFLTTVNSIYCSLTKILVKLLADMCRIVLITIYKSFAINSMLQCNLQLSGASIKRENSTFCNDLYSSGSD